MTTIKQLVRLARNDHREHIASWRRYRAARRKADSDMSFYLRGRRDALMSAARQLKRDAALRFTARSGSPDAAGLGTAPFILPHQRPPPSHANWQYA